jgi:hypothetical protein
MFAQAPLVNGVTSQYHFPVVTAIVALHTWLYVGAPLAQLKLPLVKVTVDESLSIGFNVQ